MIIERSKVSLGIYGDSLDPVKITELLGQKPTLFRQKGEVIPGPRERSKPTIATIGCWILDSDLDEQVDIEVKIFGILSQISADLKVWESLNQAYSTRIMCGLFINFVNEGFSLSPELLRQLALRGLKIEFDIYCLTKK